MARVESEFTIKDSATPILDRIAKQAEKTDEIMQKASRLTQQAGQSAMTGLNQIGTGIGTFLKQFESVNRIMSTLSGMLNMIKMEMTNFGSSIGKVSSNIKSGLVQGFNQAKTAGTGLLTKISGLVSKVPGLSSVLSGVKNVGVGTFKALGAAAQGFKAALGWIGLLLEAIYRLVQKVMNAIPAAIEKIKNNLQSLSNLITVITAGLSKLFSYGDQQRGMEFRIGIFGEGVSNTNDIRSALTNAALESYSSLEDISSLTSGIMLSGATGGNVDRSIQLAQNISKAMVATGATSEEASRSVLQLKQALSSGVLQGDELRSIREQTPGVMLALASGIRKMAEAGEIESKYANIAMGDLKQMGADGVLTSDVVVRAFEEGAESIDSIFNQMPVTFERIATTAKTVFQNMWARITDPSTVFGQMIRKALTTVQQLGEAFTNSSDKIDAFFRGFNEGMAPIYAGFIAIDNALNNLTNAFGQGGEALNKWQTAGQVAGTVIAAILGLVIAKMAILAISTIAAAWPILLIAGAFLGVAAIMSYISNGAVTLGGIFTAVGQIVVGVIMAIAQIGLAVWGVIQTIFFAIKGTIEGIIAGFVGLASGFVGLVGSLLSTIGDLVNTAANKIADFLEPLAELLSKAGVNVDLSGLRGAGSGWGAGLLDTSNLLAEMAIDWGDSAYNDFANIGDAWSKTAGTMVDVANWGVSNIEDMPNKVDNLLGTIDGFSGMGGTNVEGMYDDFFGDTTGALGDIDKNTGSTAKNTANNEVSLSDQDIEYLRSIAARDFMVNVNTAAPKVNNSFGDIRETADINAIMNTITDMVEEQLAVTLVG